MSWYVLVGWITFIVFFAVNMCVLFSMRCGDYLEGLRLAFHVRDSNKLKTYGLKTGLALAVAIAYTAAFAHIWPFGIPIMAFNAYAGYRLTQKRKNTAHE